MAKEDYFFRYLLIVKRLYKNKRGTFEEIRDYLDREFELIDKPISISLRTFQRDLIDIRSNDNGFAPNPFHSILTLANCKPYIRNHKNCKC